MEDFEKMLTDISKPEIKQLKHQDLLADQIMRSKNRTVLSFWWLLIPLYIIATLTMKTLYMKTSLKQEIGLFKTNNPILSILLFLMVPVLTIIFNAFISAKRTNVGKALIILSSLVLFIYILSCYV
jgi:drug/metabolite transporter (DMT)-like permease